MPLHDLFCVGVSCPNAGPNYLGKNQGARAKALQAVSVLKEAVSW